MIDPQCPHIKSSLPVPDILLSVRRIERFNVVTGPTAFMSIVAISSPNMAAWETSIPRKHGPINPIAPNVSFLPQATRGSETWRKTFLDGRFLECDIDPELTLQEARSVENGQFFLWFYGRVLYDD